MENEGKVPLGYFFDDGVHATINPYWAMVINSSSPYVEGAWEFVKYLLTEGQSLKSVDDHTHPMSRAAFDVLVEKEMELGSVRTVEIDGRATVQRMGGYVGEYERLGHDAYKALYDITEERAEEVRSTLEDVRALPVKTEPILEIICEEASAYFNNSKTIEEVIAIIENRVGLYLSEHN